MSAINNYQQLREADRISEILQSLAQPLTTSKYSSFKTEFGHLKSLICQSSAWPWKFSREISCLLDRCCCERNFWPSEELQFLVVHHIIAICDLLRVFKALCAANDIKLLSHALASYQTDLPESCVVVALQAILSINQDVIDNVAQDVDVIGVDKKITEQSSGSLKADCSEPSCPISKSRAVFMDVVLQVRYDRVFMIECLKNLPFELVLAFLQYLLYRIRSLGDPHIQVTDQAWAGMLVDAHVMHFTLADETHDVLRQLKREEDAAVEWITSPQFRWVYEALRELKAKRSRPKHKIGNYCIESLYLY